MNFCPFCNAKIKMTHKFCVNCGKKLPTSTEESESLNQETFNLFKKGANLQAQGKVKEAIKFYDAALKINPNAKEILFSKQLALQLLDGNDQFIRKKIMEEKPKSQQVLLKTFSDIEEIIKKTLEDINEFNEETDILKEELD